MITVDHISKSFGAITAVDDLSFTVRSGEIVGFLGPNGAGKTTTLRIITGFLSSDAGSVSVGDVSVDEHASEAQKIIGYLPENNPLYTEMIVADALSLSASLRGIKSREQRRALDFVVPATGISEIFYRPIRELSKGYRQRVGIAIALLHHPKIIIMDEPTEGLDPNQRADIRSLVKDLAKERTIIMSTHVMQEAAAVCNRLIVIADGKLVADGSPQDVIHMAKGEKVVFFDVEGKQVAESVRAVSGIEHVDVVDRQRDRVVLKIVVADNASVQPELSRLSHEHDWVIWRLAEEEHTLEDVFHELTSTHA